MFKQRENSAAMKLTKKSSLFDMSNSIKKRNVPEARLSFHLQAKQHLILADR